jgi:hypothetical protein
MPPALGDCTTEGYVDNGVGIANEDMGAQIRICRRVPASWADTWRLYRHLD